MAQFARPATDLSIGSWTNQGNASVNLWQSLDETDADESDFIQASATANDEYLCALSDVQAGIVKRGYLVRYRVRKGTAAGNQRGIVVQLRHGSDVIASNTHDDLTAIWLNGTINLTQTQVDLITDFLDLRLAVLSTGVVTGTAATRRRPQVSWMQFRVPDWQPTWETDWGADEDLSVPGIVRLTLDGETVEGATSAQARYALVERMRERVVERQTDPTADPYSDPEYLRWSRVRTELARMNKKIEDYTAYRPTLTDPADLAIVDEKLARFETIRAQLEPQERV